MKINKKLLAENNQVCQICGYLQAMHSFSQQKKCKASIESQTLQKCRYCGKSFSSTIRTIFCSIECRNSDIEEIRRARAGHMYWDVFN